MRRMKYLQWGLCGAALVSLAGCGEATFAVGEEEANLNAAEDEITISNAISANAISANAISANAISANAISANAISANAISANAISANSLLPNAVVNNSYIMSALNDPSTSPDPRYPNMGRLNEEFLRYAYSCAMPAGTSMTLTLSRGDVTFEGAIGLAPEWATGVCDLTCQRWVSACLIARVNGYSVPIDISIRGNHAALATTTQEEDEFTLFEGRFWGNVFTNEFESNLSSCSGTGATSGQITSRICAQKGGYCGIKSMDACGLQCNAQQNCQAKLKSNGSTVNVPSIAVYLREPDPSMCGDDTCEPGETSSTCAHDCPTTITTAAHETAGTWVRTLATAPLNHSTAFYAGITNSPTLAGLGALNPPDVAGTEDTFVFKANADGSYSAATRLGASGEDPVGMEVDAASGRLIMANEYSLRSFSTTSLSLQWTRQESTSSNRFRFEFITIRDGHVHALGYAQTYNGTSWSTTAREYRKYNLSTGAVVGTPDAAPLNTSWKHFTDGGCHAYMVRAINSTSVEIRGNALTQNNGCSTATDWTRQVTVPGIASPRPTAITQGMVVAGTDGALTSSFIARYFDNGTDFVWVNKITPAEGRAVHIARAMTWGQNVVVAGQFKGPVDFRGSITSSLPGQWPGVNANEDIFVAAYDLATGELRWVRTYGGPGVDTLTAFNFDTSNRLWLFGDFVGTPTLEGNFVTAVGGALDTDGMRVTVGPLPMGAPQSLSTTSDGAHSLMVEGGKVKVWGDNTQGQLGLGYSSPTPIAVPEELPGIENAIKASSGTNFSMVLLGDGKVVTFGSNAQGQLGSGSLTPTSRNTPAEVPGLVGVVDIVANDQSALALLADGTVKAWGLNSNGQLGDGTVTRRTSPVTVSLLENIVALSGGNRTSMALDIHGRVWSWGAGASGALGSGSTGNRTIPALVQGVERSVQISAGGSSGFAVQANGRVRAWGNNANGKLGDGTTTNRLVPIGVPALNDVVDISAGNRQTIARTAGGNILTWGAGDMGQLGNGQTTTVTTPTLLPNLRNARSVYAGKDASLAVLETGDVVGFGNGSELGAGRTTGTALLPVKLSKQNLSQLGGGMGFTLALRPDGGVWSAGGNNLGTLGNGTTGTSRSYMAPVQGLTDVRAISIGEGLHAMAAMADGTVKAWGSNSYGQLGDGTTITRSLPVVVPGLVTTSDLAVGAMHTVALDVLGRVFTFGNNTNGQLGDGTTTASTTPIQVPGLTNVIAVEAGRDHSLALKADGTVWAWGKSSDGQCGTGLMRPNTLRYKSPVQVIQISNIIAIAAGRQFSVALDSNGKVYTWGSNYRGQIGDGTEIDQPTPFQVPGLSNVIGIAAGGNHVLALKSDGTVWAWGFNTYGELGDGTNEQRLTPVQVVNLQGVAEIKAVHSQSIAVKRDGTFWMWGSNAGGNFGNHTTADSNRPVQILDL